MLTSAVALSPGSCAQQPQVQPSLGGSGQGALRSSLTKSHLVPALARWCCALALLARTQSGSCACQEVQQLSLFLDMAHTNANYRLSLPGLSATPGSCAAQQESSPCSPPRPAPSPVSHMPAGAGASLRWSPSSSVFAWANGYGNLALPDYFPASFPQASGRFPSVTPSLHVRQ